MSSGPRPQLSGLRPAGRSNEMGERNEHRGQSDPHEIVDNFHHFELVILFIDESQEPVLTVGDPTLADPPGPDAEPFQAQFAD